MIAKHQVPLRHQGERQQQHRKEIMAANLRPQRRGRRRCGEKGPKQTKNSQLLAAAPTPSSRGAGSPGLQPNTAAGRGSSGSNAFPQFDGPAGGTSNFIPQFVPSTERVNIPMTPNFDVMSQPFVDQERMGSAPPMSFDAQQDRRSNPQQTSSYWSVPEQNDFPALLQHFGTDWGAIAKHMTSKTHVMVYTTVFQQWLNVPLDSNKSRRVANIQTQVKNYFSRQVESGKMGTWEQIARDADEKKARGESTGPPPAATIIPKRRYEPPQGSIPRSGSAMDLDDVPATGPNMMTQQASPPQPNLSTRFPTLAQAGPVPQPAVQPAPSASLLNKQQAPQQMQPQNRPRGTRPRLFQYRTPTIHYAALEFPTISIDAKLARFLIATLIDGCARSSS